jgi:periplasmic nitrate reductase NapD
MSDKIDVSRRRLMVATLEGATSAHESHISSLVIHAFPEQADRVATELAALPGVEIHARDPNGKFVVTLETAHEGEIVARLTDIHSVAGVLSAALVFHHVEPERG